MAIAKDIAEVERQGETKVHILDADWDINQDFWSHFGGSRVVRSIPEPKNDDDNYWKETADNLSLWRVSDATGNMKVTSVAKGEIKRSQLDSK
ncbi:hypothetical protein OSTOST_02382, partial [Ostertagia ostertagi]